MVLQKCLLKELVILPLDHLLMKAHIILIPKVLHWEFCPNLPGLAAEKLEYRCLKRKEQGQEKKSMWQNVNTRWNRWRILQCSFTYFTFYVSWVTSIKLKKKKKATADMFGSCSSSLWPLPIVIYYILVNSVNWSNLKMPWILDMMESLLSRYILK